MNETLNQNDGDSKISSYKLEPATRFVPLNNEPVRLRYMARRKYPHKTFPRVLAEFILGATITTGGPLIINQGINELQSYGSSGSAPSEQQIIINSAPVKPNNLDLRIQCKDENGQIVTVIIPNSNLRTHDAVDNSVHGNNAVTQLDTGTQLCVQPAYGGEYITSSPVSGSNKWDQVISGTYTGDYIFDPNTTGVSQ